MLIDQAGAFWIVGTVSLASLLGVLISFFLLHRPFKALDKFKALSQDVADNKFTLIKDVKSPQEFRELADALNTMTVSLDKTFSKLKSSEEEKDQIIDQLAHDIKTPISSIKATIEAIIDQIIPEQQYPVYFKNIDHQVARLNQLVEEMSYISSKEFHSKTTPVKVEPVSLDNLIVNVLSDFQFLIDAEHRDIIVNISPEANQIVTDSNKLYRILTNLISNTFKYSAEGSSITISAEVIPSGIALSIQDEGIGISKEEQQKIFNRLYRVEKSRNTKTGGHGLGLYITKELVKQLNGQIMVESKLNSGSTFIVKLPKRYVAN